MDHYVVAGNPVEHSLSPLIHAEFARQTGQAMTYGRVLWPLDGVADAARELAASGVVACNVTVPFKFDAYHLAAVASERATLAEAANVLVFDAGGWRADNTDGIGLIDDLTRHAGIEISGRRVLLIGAGGAAAGALGPLLAERPAELVVVNRSVARAHALVARHRMAAGSTALRAAGLEQGGTGFDLVVNASSSSLQGAPVPVPTQVLAPGATAFDMMYGAPALPFLDWATRHGAHGRDGLGMLVAQAAFAFEGWRGVRPDTAPVLAMLRAQVDGTRSSG